MVAKGEDNEELAKVMESAPGAHILGWLYECGVCGMSTCANNALCSGCMRGVHFP